VNRGDGGSPDGGRADMSKRRRHPCARREAPRRPLLTLAALRDREPEAWKVFQDLLTLWLDQSPQIVQLMSANGLGREATHEAAEQLVDSGFLRLTQDQVGFRFVLWNPIDRRYYPCGACQ
jgi:hypothetical protein